MNALTQPGQEVDKPCAAHAANLETIIRAAREGTLSLLECRLVATGEKIAVLTAIGRDGEDYVMTPFAAMFNGNPYEMLQPPDPNGGFRL